MLNDEEDDGFLIDLEPGHQVGPRKGFGSTQKKRTLKFFMAIGALYGEEHSFMHDLESFFLGPFLGLRTLEWARPKAGQKQSMSHGTTRTQHRWQEKKQYS